MGQHTKKVSKSRGVCYHYEARFHETTMEKLLQKAQDDGVVTLFDTGRGSTVWFEGPPGAEMRAVKAAVEAVIAQGERPFRDRDGNWRIWENEVLKVLTTCK